MFDDSSPEAAIKMQTGDTERFTTMITSQFNAAVYNFCIYAKESEWNDYRCIYKIKKVE